MSYISAALKKAQESRTPKGGQEVHHKYSSMRKASRVPLLIGGIFVFACFVALYFIFLPERHKDISFRTPPKPVSSPPQKEPAKDVALLYKRALKHHYEGASASAEAIYREVLKLDANHYEAMNNLGVICLLKGKWEDAEGFFKMATEVKKGYALPYYNLSCLEAKRGNIKASLEYLERAVTLDPRAAKWAENDEDLKSLRSQQEFKRLIEKRREDGQ